MSLPASLFRRQVAWLRSLFRGGREDAEAQEELRFHLEMETEKNLRAGLDLREARRRAHVRLGGVDAIREAVRDARGGPMKLRMSWLDLKLAGRMLSRYPGLTLVGGFSFAFAIAVAAMAFEFLTQLVHPSLPVPGGDRIVALRMWDAAAGRPERRALHEFMLWRDELRSVDDIGVFSVIERNLRWRDVAGAPVRGSAISEAAFRVAGVPAQLGRTLVAADEEPGAAPVVVLGHDVWRGAFASAPDIVGRQVRVGGEPHTVVGVMPVGFAFPISESFWVPFRLTSSSYPPLEGPPVRTFGRLAPDADLEAAQAELTTVTRRVVPGSPETHRQLRAQVLPFPNEVMDISKAVSVGLMSSNGLFILFLILMAANVALLVFVRAATREREILVRVALGADRGRVVAQLFAEALVLGLVGAFVGLLATGVFIRWAFRTFESLEGQLPFWFGPSLSLTTVAYALGLTALGALVAGALPGLKITEGNLESRLRQSSTGLPSTGVSRLWSGIIVVQVAMSALAVPIAYTVFTQMLEKRGAVVPFDGSRYASARVEMDREDELGAGPRLSEEAFAARYRERYEELRRRLEAEPGVRAVTLANRFARMSHPQSAIEVETDGDLTPPRIAPRVGTASVAPDYFDALDTRVLAGRGFDSGDADSDQGVVIVNRSFVDRVLGGRNAVGRRVRYAPPPGRDAGAETEPWYEIVGVVPDLAMLADDSPDGAGMYHPLAQRPAYPVYVSGDVGGDAHLFASRLRTLAESVDPALRLDEILLLDQVGGSLMLELTLTSTIVTGVGALAILLSLAGIYSVTAFRIERRTREIGLRAALGADRLRIVMPMLKPVFIQVGLGISFAVGIIFLLGVVQSARGAAIVAAFAVFTLAISILACAVPIRRALRVEPTEALRAEI